MDRKPSKLTAPRATPEHVAAVLSNQGRPTKLFFDTRTIRCNMNFDVHVVRITDKKGAYFGTIEWDESVGGYRFKTSTTIQWSADDLRDVSDAMNKLQAERELND